MTPELLNKLKHLANIAAHLPTDVTLEDEDAAMKALHGELAADTVLQMIALAERALLAAAPAPIQQEPVLWVESEPSIRDKDARYAINSLCHTVVYHMEKPDTTNPVWPLYAATPARVDTVGGEARDAALEDAAKAVEAEICECCLSEDEQAFAEHAANTIRNLKSKPNADCSGEPANYPDNEGYGCACDPMNKEAMREQT